jgi:hypothetical protein
MKTCEFCGKGEREHVDNWGRWEACLDQIISTTLAHVYIGGQE